jgi:hypothetical protein
MVYKPLLVANRTVEDAGSASRVATVRTKIVGPQQSTKSFLKHKFSSTTKCLLSPGENI